MLKTRLCAVGIGLLTAATFTLAGCGDEKPAGSDTTPPTTSAPQADAKDTFVSAVNKLKEQSAKVEGKMDGLASLDATGQNDPIAKKSAFDIEMSISGTTMKVSLITIDPDAWVKMSGIPGLPDKWMHVTVDKVKAGSNLDKMLGDDPAGTETFAAGIVKIEWDGASAVKGTLDLTKTSVVDADVLKQLGDKASAVPFTATFDGEGRLSVLTVDMNAVMPGAGKMTTTYSGYGEPVKITKPAGSDVIEMPAQILSNLNQ